MRPHHRNNKDHREKREADVIFGRWPVKEALASGGVVKLLLANGARDVDDLVALAREKKIPFHWLERDRLDQLAPGNHQGVVAHVSTVSFVSSDEVLDKSKSTKGPAIVALDGVLDPQNLGSILRSSNFFGVPSVVIPKWRAATVTAAVVRASAGAALKIPIAQVANLASFLETAKKKGFWIVGADMDGQDAKKADVPRPFVLVMGSEGEGLHQLVRKKCDLIVGISSGGAAGAGVSSLNVGVAAGILIHSLSKPA
jgi:23S rRNA (guanosine2251-2'-O)-methyltransferase